MIVSLEFSDQVRPAWLRDDISCRLPLPPGPPATVDGEVLVHARSEQGRTPLVARAENGGGGRVALAYDWPRWRAFLLQQRYHPPLHRPLYTRMPVHYHYAPAFIRNYFAEKMAPVDEDTSEDDYPGFPIEQGYEALEDVLRQLGVAAARELRPKVCLTHDIDKRQGFEYVRWIAEREMDFGFRSQWNVVGHHYPIDHRKLDWLVENGHEVGFHGYNHDCKLAFLSEGAIRRRFDTCYPLIKRYRMGGFRSPSYFRSPTLTRVLRDYFDYDLTYLDADWLCVGGKGGCLTVRPFELDGLPVVPTTLPAEFSFSSGGIKISYDYLYWKPKIDWLFAVGGHAVVNTHPDPNYTGSHRGLAAYSEFLEALAETYGDSWALPRDLAKEADSVQA